MFLASVESVILAKGLSAPQHSTYFVILLDGRDLLGTPGIAKKIQNHKSATASKIALNILEKIIRKNTMGEDNEYEDD